MPLFIDQNINPPTDWQAFERLCADLWARIWNDDRTSLNGRKGQPQCGVDVWGRPNKGNYYAGIQCKGKNNDYGRAVTVSELREEVEKAKSFTPALSEFILATTAPTDDKLQQEARKITIEHRRSNLFDVDVMGWEEIQRRLGNYKEIIRRLLARNYGLKGVEKTPGKR